MRIVRNGNRFIELIEQIGPADVVILSLRVCRPANVANIELSASISCFAT